MVLKSGNLRALVCLNQPTYSICVKTIDCPASQVETLPWGAAGTTGVLPCGISVGALSNIFSSFSSLTVSCSPFSTSPSSPSRSPSRSLGPGLIRVGPLFIPWSLSTTCRASAISRDNWSRSFGVRLSTSTCCLSTFFKTFSMNLSAADGQKQQWLVSLETRHPSITLTKPSQRYRFWSVLGPDRRLWVSLSWVCCQWVWKCLKKKSLTASIIINISQHSCLFASAVLLHASFFLSSERFPRNILC